MYAKRYGITRSMMANLGGAEHFDKCTELGREILMIIAKLELATRKNGPRLPRSRKTSQIGRVRLQRKPPATVRPLDVSEETTGRVARLMAASARIR